MEFAVDRWGKPRLMPDDGLQFSLPHAGDLALIAAAGGMPVGVDVEAVRELLDLAGMSRLVLSAEEQAMAARLPDDRRCPAFFTAWARKEVVLEAIGAGLAVDPATVTVGW